MARPLGCNHENIDSGRCDNSLKMDIETMADVRGKRVAALSEYALGGWLAAVGY